MNFEEQPSNPLNNLEDESIPKNEHLEDPSGEVGEVFHENKSEHADYVSNLEKERRVTWEDVSEIKNNKDSFYRIVDESGYVDLLEQNTIRSSPTGTESNITNGIDIGHRPTSFPAFDKGSPNLDYSNLHTTNYFIESQHPMYKRGQINPITNNEIKGRHWGYRAIDIETGETLNEIPNEHILNIYKKDLNEKIFIQKTKTTTN